MICDLAETYQIFDYTRVPVKLLGILVAGLHYNARINRERRDEDYELNTFLLATIADSVNMLLYGFFNDKKGKKPDLFIDALTKKDDKADYLTFDRGEDLMAYRQMIMES